MSISEKSKFLANKQRNQLVAAISKGLEDVEISFVGTLIKFNVRGRIAGHVWFWYEDCSHEAVPEDNLEEKVENFWYVSVNPRKFAPDSEMTELDDKAHELSKQLFKRVFNACSKLEFNIAVDLQREE